MRLTRRPAHRDGDERQRWRGRSLIVVVGVALVGAAAGVIIDRALWSDNGTHTPAPALEAPPLAANTSTTSEEPEYDWSHFFENLADEPSCSWRSGPLHAVDGVSLLTVRPECWPGIGADELWWLAVSQTLAGAWEVDDPETWQRRLLARCTDLDTAAVGINALGSPLINPAALAYAQYRGLTDSFIAEAELAETDEAWQLAELRWAAVIAEDMASGAGLAWKYTALTATSLYCPEHRTHLRHHRDERLTLEATVRRCATSRDGWCVRLNDIAVTSRTRPTLDAIAQMEADSKVARE